MEQDPTIEAAWCEVLDSFEDERAHKRFLTLCSSTGRLREAGARYRRIKEDPDDPRAEIASSQVDRLLALAMQDLQVLKTPPERRRNTKAMMFLVAFGVSAALVFGALWSMLRAT